MPDDYADIDFVAQESDLRLMALGPAHEWATLLPQHDGPHPLVENNHTAPTGDEQNMLDTKQHMKVVNTDGGVEFLRDCSDHMSSCIKARILHDRMRGLMD